MYNVTKFTNSNVLVAYNVNDRFPYKYKGKLLIVNEKNFSSLLSLCKPRVSLF